MLCVHTESLIISKLKYIFTFRPTFQHFDSNSLAGRELVDPEGGGLHHFSKSSVAESFTWQRQITSDKWSEARGSRLSGAKINKNICADSPYQEKLWSSDWAHFAVKFMVHFIQDDSAGQR